MTCTIRVGRNGDWMIVVVGELLREEFLKISALIKVNKLAVPIMSDVNPNINLNQPCSDFESFLHVV